MSLAASQYRCSLTLSDHTSEQMFSSLLASCIASNINNGKWSGIADKMLTGVGERRQVHGCGASLVPAFLLGQILRTLRLNGICMYMPGPPWPKQSTPLLYDTEKRVPFPIDSHVRTIWLHVESCQS